MIDLKAFTPSLHRTVTRSGNTAVLRSIRFLHPRGKLAEVRLLVIPGVTDEPAELMAYGQFLAGIDPGLRLRLMPFRHLGTRPPARAWPEATAQSLIGAAASLSSTGLTNVVIQ